MPLAYTSILEEALAVRQAAGLFDLSHLGEIEVSGAGDVFFLQRMLTRNLASLRVGRATYSLMCNEQGGIVDDLLVYRLPDRYLLVVNAANVQKDLDWLRARAPRGVRITDVSEQTVIMAIQGPFSVSILDPIADVEVAAIKFQGWAAGRVAGERALIARTGYTGEDGFELILAPERAATVWNELLQAGSAWGLKPAGLGARDVLRLEAGFPLYGEDIDESCNPLEAGLERFVDLAKVFVGQGPLLRIKQRGPARLLVGIEMREQAIPRHGNQVLSEGRSVGYVTSGVYSPTLNRGIGFAFVSSRLAARGTSLEVMIRGRPRQAQVAKVPFVKHTAHGGT